MLRLSERSNLTALDEESLPEGWALAQIRDLVDIHYGKSLREDNRKVGPIAVYGSNGIVGSHNMSLTNGPTIILGRKGTIGAVHLCASGCWPIDTTYYINRFHDLDPTFLAAALRNLGLSELDTSTAIPGLNRDDVYEQTIALPPSAEQKRLGTQLERCVNLINSARNRLSRIPAILKRFRQAVLAAACSGRLTEDWRQQNPSVQLAFHTTVGKPLAKNADLPDEWKVASVESVCEVVVDCPHSTPRWTTDGLICVRTTSFKLGFLDLSDVRYVSESTYNERTSRLAPKSGDVLYSREGGILGIACLVPPGVKLCLGQRMMLMRTNSSICDSTFLMHVLNGPATIESVKDLTGGSASPHLNVADIKTFPVPQPPLPEQQEIVRRVGVLLSVADDIEKRTADAGCRVDQLTQSILAKAFRGELVPAEAELARREGREYEPASVLLERIKAEREEQPILRKRTRKSVATAER